MSFWHFLGGVLAPGHQEAADDASAAVDKTLSPGSTYYAPSDYLGDNDASALAGAAALQTNPIGLNTDAMDADSQALGGLGAQLANIQAHGGQLEQAASAQAASDVANQGTAQERELARAAQNQVLSTGTQERSAAASEANQSRAAQLANLLKKQTYSAAVNHANLQAALAGKGIQNDLANSQYNIDSSLQEGAQAARGNQANLNLALQGQNFNNAMTVGNAAIGALSQGVGTASGMLGGSGNSGVSSGTAQGNAVSYGDGSGTSSGYSLPGTALGSGSKAVMPSLTDSTPNSYVNPFTGSTITSTVPNNPSSWGDWLNDTSTLVT